MKVDIILIVLLCALTLAIPLTAANGQALTTGVIPPNSHSAAESPSEPDAQTHGQSSGTPVSLPPEEDVDAADGEAYASGIGVFFIYNQTTGLVDEVPVFDFVRGAIAAEMPARYHEEALIAQGIAAYTYALMQAEQNRDSGQMADFSADPSNLQVYMTESQAREFYGVQFDLYWAKITGAAQVACQYILLYDEEPIAAAYHAISNGITEGSEYIWGSSREYLAPVESMGDVLSPDFQSTASFTAAQLEQILIPLYPEMIPPVNEASWIEILERSPSGYVTQVEVGGIVISGQELRTALGLRSTSFDLEIGDGSYIFHVTGYGHGAGLSQYGSDYMARQGSSYQDILAHYYQGASLARVVRY